jgi:hypothetical protein
MRTTVIWVLLTLSISVFAESWRFPTDQDITGDWKTFHEQMPTPYLVRADFDGNGVEDESWIVINSSGSGWRLIALMNGSRVAETLVSAADGSAQTFGIEKIEPGSYKTACGKGYWECSPNEPELLSLNYAAFRFFKFESASTIWYWDELNHRFNEIAESD